MRFPASARLTLADFLRAQGKNPLSCDGSQVQGVAAMYAIAGRVGDRVGSALLIHPAGLRPEDPRVVLSMRYETPYWTMQADVHGLASPTSNSLLAYHPPGEAMSHSQGPLVCDDVLLIPHLLKLFKDPSFQRRAQSSYLVAGKGFGPEYEELLLSSSRAS